MLTIDGIVIQQQILLYFEICVLQLNKRHTNNQGHWNFVLGMYLLLFARVENK